MMIWDTISWCLTIVVCCEIVHQLANFASMGGSSKVPQTIDNRDVNGYVSIIYAQTS